MGLSKQPKYLCILLVSVFLFGCSGLHPKSEKSSSAIINSTTTNCVKKADAYLLAIGNLDSDSYEVIEMQVGLGNLDPDGNTVYNPKYRLSGYPREFSMKLVLDSKTCALKSATISRE